MITAHLVFRVEEDWRAIVKRCSKKPGPLRADRLTER